MSRDLVTIAQYRDLPQAGLARSILESHGVTCFLGNEFTVGVNWLYSNALGGVKLQVIESDVARAKEILQETYQEVGTPAGGEVDGLAGGTCPRCGEAEVETRNYTRKFAAISLLLTLPLFFFLKRYRCKKCGHAWK